LTPVSPSTTGSFRSFWPPTPAARCVVCLHHSKGAECCHKDESTKLLAIQGAAGSGKTSVALHRASYLLYRHKKQIKTDNLVILSSTDVLGDYISDVLPELGEDEIKGITFQSVAAKYLPYTHMRIQSHPQLLEQVLTTDSGFRRQLTAQIAFKSSRAFLAILDRFYDYALDHLFHFEDLTFRNHPVISEKELRQLFYRDFSRMPPLARLKRIENRINDTLKPLKRSHRMQRHVSWRTRMPPSVAKKPVHFPESIWPMRPRAFMMH
jgi:DNA helicase-2/ATP-dependent DNA helicase PcrA